MPIKKTTKKYGRDGIEAVKKHRNKKPAPPKKKPPIKFSKRTRNA